MDFRRGRNYFHLMTQATETLFRQIRELSQDELHELLANLTRDLDADSLQAVANLIETRRRAEELKSGAVQGLSHDEVFGGVREKLG